MHRYLFTRPGRGWVRAIYDRRVMRIAAKAPGRVLMASLR
jgi:hypothetical protein